jgi:hypothetical protein
MIKKLFSFFFLWSFFLANAQYTSVINSNRPGLSESPYSIGTGVYQLEMGIFQNSSKIVRTFTIPNSFGTNLFFRTSFFKEKLEFNTNISFQKDKVAFKNVFTSHYFTTGLSKLTIGAKYLVFQQEHEDKSKEVRSWKRRHAFDWKRAIPSVAVYAGINTNFVNDIHKSGGMSPKIGVLLQNNLSKKLNIVTNIFYDYIGTDFTELSYIVTGTYALNEEWSTFIEHQGAYSKYQTNNNFGGGVAYLANSHFQIDASTRVNFNGKTTESYAAIGFSFRLDRHVPDFKLIDANGNEIIEEMPVVRKKKNFINKVFNFFKFKKKEKEPTDKDGNTYKRKRPVRKRIKAVAEGEKKKKKGGFFSFLKKNKKKKKSEKKKKKETKKTDDTKNDN